MFKFTTPKIINRLTVSTTFLLFCICSSLSATNLAAPGTLVTYTYQHELLPQNDGEPLLTVYSDGSMRAVFPTYMKRSGTYLGQLSSEQLQALKTLISTPELKGFNAKALSEEIALREAQQEQLEGKGKTYYAVMDSTTTIIQLATTSDGTSNETLGGKTPIKKIVQKDLSAAAKQHPDIPTLQKTQELRSMLQNILDTSDWTKAGDNS